MNSWAPKLVKEDNDENAQHFYEMMTDGGGPGYEHKYRSEDKKRFIFNVK